MATDHQSDGAVVPGAGEQLRRLIERLAFQANRAGKQPRPDAVHDLRVAIRRTEQGLAALKSVLPRKTVKRIRKQLKAVLSRAGIVRDYDIALEILAKNKAPESADLRRDIRARRKAAERSLLTRLNRLSVRTRISQWLADLELHTLQTKSLAETGTVSANSLPRLAERFFRDGDSAASHHSGEKLHDFRIRAKKFRYTLELFVPVYGPVLERRIPQIKSVQSVLGRMNDYRSVLAMADDAGCGKKLITSLKRSERRQARKFRELWAEQFSSSVAAEWQRALKTQRLEPAIPRKPMAASGIPQQQTAAGHA